jgi:methyl-accepting chemotaxis protein
MAFIRTVENLSVTTKIYSSFGVVLLLLVTIFAFGFNGFVTVGHEIEEMNEAAEEVASIAHIEAKFLKLRTHTREFANTGKENDAKTVHVLAKELTPKIEAIISQVQKLPEMLEKAQHLQKEFKIYIKDFAIAETLEHEFIELIHKKLEPAGEKIIKDLDEIAKAAKAEGNGKANELATTAREHALLARLYVNILIGRKDESFGPKANQELALFKKYIDELGKAELTDHEKKLHTELNSLYTEYQNTFKKVHKDERDLRHLVDGEMKEAGDLLVEDAEWMQSQALQTEHKIKEESESQIALAEIEMAIAGGIGLLLGLLAAGMLSKMISSPVSKMTEAMRKLADDDLEVEIPALGRTDEIGHMADAVQIFKDNAIEQKRLQAENEKQRLEQEDAKEQERQREVEQQNQEIERKRQEQEAEAERQREDLERERAEEAAVAQRRREALETEELQKLEVEKQRKLGMLQMANEFEQQVMGVLQTVSESASDMSNTATSMVQLTNDSSEKSSSVSAAAEEASTNVQTVAAAAEELSSSITEISSQVNQSASVASQAESSAQTTNQKVLGLAEAATKIGEVVELINDIASQTNLLALNATIEAARAGEAGKGFAVVASEVGNLANQTAKATEEISSQINGIQTATNESVEAIGEITTTIGQMNEIASGISAAVEEQGAATKEIARNVEQAATGTQEVTINIVAVAEQTSSVGNSAEEVRVATGEMTKQSEELTATIHTFLDGIRSDNHVSDTEDEQITDVVDEQTATS